jgi:hypothetical protein
MARKRQPKVYYAYLDIDSTEVTVKQYQISKEVTVEISDLDDFCGNDGEKVIFINNLNIIMKFLAGGEVSKTFKVSKYDGKTIEPTSYVYKNVRFRSFSLMKPESMKSKELCNLFNTNSVVCAMEQYVDMCGGPFKCSATVSSQAKKIFYEDIKDELKVDRCAKRRYFNNVEMYNLCYAGCKSGEISSVDNVKIFDNAESYDLSSAYSSVMVNDDKFPIGKIKPTYDKNLIVKRFNNKQWVKVVFNGKIPEYDKYYDEKVDMTAFEYYDILLELNMGRNIFDMCNENTSYLYTDSTGYLNDKFRNQIVNVYNEKASLSKSDPKRILVKQELEAIYGKGIQWHDFKTDDDVKKFYRGRGDNYIQPQMANHCSAAIRYYVSTAVNSLDDEAIYWDTDGIKVKSSDFVTEYFEKLNDKIMERNAIAGYPDCNIGTWHHEATCKKICLIRPKIYVYADDDIVMKCAGMDEKGKQLCLIKTFNNNCKPFDTWKKEGFPLYTTSRMIKDGKIITRYLSTILK